MARDDEPREIAARDSDKGWRRRDVVLGGALLAASGIAYGRLPRDQRRLIGNHKLEDLVPKTFAGWRFETTSGLVLPPSDQLSDRIYSQLLTRQYSNADGSSVMLLIAYSGAQDGVIQVHRPEVCYPASGYRLTENEAFGVKLTDRVAIPTRYIVAERDLRREQLIYWTRLGAYFPSSWAEQRMAVIRENLAGIVPDGVLIRFSSVADTDARGVLDRFASELYDAVGPAMKQVMAGTSAVVAPPGR